MKKWLEYSLLSVISGSIFLFHAAYADTSTVSDSTSGVMESNALQISENAVTSEDTEMVSSTTEISTVQHLSPAEQQLRAERANRLYDTAERYRRLGDQTQALESYRSALFIFEVLAASSEAGEAQESFQVAAEFVRSRISELRQSASQAES